MTNTTKRSARTEHPAVTRAYTALLQAGELRRTTYRAWRDAGYPSEVAVFRAAYEIAHKREGEARVTYINAVERARWALPE